MYGHRQILTLDQPKYGIYDLGQFLYRMLDVDKWLGWQCDLIKVGLLWIYDFCVFLCSVKRKVLSLCLNSAVGRHSFKSVGSWFHTRDAAVKNHTWSHRNTRVFKPPGKFWTCVCNISRTWKVLENEFGPGYLSARSWKVLEFARQLCRRQNMCVHTPLFRIVHP